VLRRLLVPGLLELAQQGVHILGAVPVHHQDRIVRYYGPRREYVTYILLHHQRIDQRSDG
jgi:hypothetical protein